MARAKASGKRPRKKTKKLSEKIAKLKSVQQPEKINPFEVHINRQKNKVIGQKTKHDKGLPGVARSKSLKKRKETLLQEYQKKHKSNVMIDRRIGENDVTMSLEDKMTARFTAERQIAEEKKLRRGKKMFNLNDEEDLTHYGQSLAEIEKFDDPQSDDDSDEERFAEDFLKQTSFGGILKKKNNDDDTNAIFRNEKTREQKIDEMIALSKLKKLERQNKREELFTLTEKLDADWKEMRSLLNLKNDSAPAAATTTTTERDSYDMLVSSLKFEARGKPQDRLKSEEELTIEENKKLEKLEAERLARMRASDETDMKPTHISADDLDDNFDLGDKKRSVFKLLYKDGKLVQSEDEDEDDDDEDSECKEDDNLLNKDENSNKDSSSESEEEEEEEEEIEDNFSDVESDIEENDKTSDEESESSVNIPMKLQVKVKKSKKKEILQENDKTSDEESESSVKIPMKSQVKVKKSKKKEILQENDKTSDEESESSVKIPMKSQVKLKKNKKDEIPNEFVVPETLEELMKLLDGYFSSDRAIIIERIIKSNNSKLKANSNKKLEEFFKLLLDYIDYIILNDDDSLETVDKFVPFLFDWTQQSPLSVATCFLELLKKKRNNYTENSMQYLTGIKSVLPQLDTFVLFQMVSILFPTSDFRHKVVTPTLLFMGQILSECRPNSRKDLTKGIYLCTQIFEYVSLSKRFVPEVLNYLSGILSLAVNCSEHEKSSLVLPPFKANMKATLMIDSPDISKNIVLCPFKLHELTIEKSFTDEFRVNSVWTCCELLLKFAEMYQEMPSFQVMFISIQRWLKKLPLSHYPRQVQETIESLDVMLRTRHLLTPLMRTRKRPQSIKFFEPQIEDDFTGRKSKKKSSKPAESLRHVVKRETKGALRELRRDNQFLAKHQLDEQIERDAVRKRKVKKLYGNLADQEGEYKALTKKRKKN